MLIYKYIPDVTTVAGGWSGNTELISGGLCRQVYIKPNTDTTNYDARLVDENDIDIRKWTDQTGELNDLTPILISGICSLIIENATADEAFTVLICVNDG